MKRSVHKLELTGMVFGRLTVIGKAERKGSCGEIYWNCRCECGRATTARAHNLRHGTSQSCGCLHRERVSTHHMTGLPTFKSWDSMKQRCTNPKAPDYPRYGGRGITVCKQWLNSFDAFLSDMGSRPTGTTLDRKDNDGNYEPSNCRWATPTQQQLNRKNTRLIMHEGRMKTISELAAQTGVSKKLIGDRLYAGWGLEAILLKASRKQH